MRSGPIAIIGAGPAGCAAAVQCKRLGQSPILIERTGAAGGLTAEARAIENYPGLEPIPGRRFSELLGRHLGRFGIAVEKAEVASLSAAGGGFLVRSNAGEVRAAAVIAAVGTAPRALPIPGAADLEGVRLFYGVRDLLDRGDIGAGCRVLVIGSGEAALDHALALADRGASVSVMARGASPRAVGRLRDEACGHPRIMLRFGVRPSAARPAPEGIAVAFDHDGGSSEEIGCAAVVAIGRRPTAGALFEGLDAERSQTLSTRVPGLFVAGDARTGRLGQIGMAVGDGLAAAMAAVTHLERGPER